jgi:DivIVA domain-containing protein
MRRKRKDDDTGLLSESTHSHRLTPVDVQQKEFRLAFRGYNERDVDAFLDEVTEELTALQEERKRLQEAAGSGSTGDGSPGVAMFDTAEASREAEEVLARAREEADAIVRDAEYRATGMASSGSISMGDEDAEAVSAFLGQEREFLQNLAALIQRHAESVKDIARRARETQERQERPDDVPVATEAGGERPWAAILEPPQEVPTPAPEEPDRVTIVETASSGPEAPAEEARVSDEGKQDERREPGAPEPSRSAPVGAEPATARDEGARSLRELFWGED